MTSSSVEEELVLLGGKHQSLSELISELLEVSGLELLNGVGKFLGDLDSVDQEVVLNELNGLLWVLGDLGNLVKSGPVEGILLDLSAGDHALLDDWDGRDLGDDTWDSLLEALVLPGLHELLDTEV